jgi:hypothetical protein
VRVEPVELFFDDPEEVFRLLVRLVDAARLFCELPERLLLAVRDLEPLDLGPVDFEPVDFELVGFELVDFEPVERACPERAELPLDLLSERACFCPSACSESSPSSPPRNFFAIPTAAGTATPTAAPATTFFVVDIPSSLGSIRNTSISRSSRGAECLPRRRAPKQR